jgi:hypothetical protein
MLRTALMTAGGVFLYIPTYLPTQCLVPTLLCRLWLAACKGQSVQETTVRKDIGVIRLPPHWFWGMFSWWMFSWRMNSVSHLFFAELHPILPVYFYDEPLVSPPVLVFFFFLPKILIPPVPVTTLVQFY